MAHASPGGLTRSKESVTCLFLHTQRLRCPQLPSGSVTQTQIMKAFKKKSDLTLLLIIANHVKEKKKKIKVFHTLLILFAISGYICDMRHAFILCFKGLKAVALVNSEILILFIATNVKELKGNCCHYAVSFLSGTWSK